MNNKIHIKAELDINIKEPELFCSNENLLVFYRDSQLEIFDLVSGNALFNFTFNDVKAILFYGNSYLLVITNDVYMLDTECFEIKEICKISKASAAHKGAVIYKDSLLIRKVDGCIYYYTLSNKDGYKIKLLQKFIFNSIGTELFITDNYYGCYSSECYHIYSMSELTSSPKAEKAIFGTIGIIELNLDVVLVVNNEGMFYNGLNDQLINDFSIAIDFITVFDNKQIVAADHRFFYFISFADSPQIDRKVDLYEILYSHSSFIREDSLPIVSSEDAGVYKIIKLTPSYVLTSDMDIILHNNLETIYKILSFSVNLTNFVSNHSNIILATFYGCIKISTYLTLLETSIIPLAESSINCMESSSNGDLVFIGTDDGSCYILEFRKEQVMIKAQWKESSSITALDISDDGSTIVYSKINNEVVISKINGEVIHCFKSHKNRIIYACITDLYVITADENGIINFISNTNFSIEVIDLKEKPISSSCKGGYLLVTTAKSIKIIKMHKNGQINDKQISLIKSHSTSRPDVCCEILEVDSLSNPYFLAVNDGVKVYTVDQSLVWYNLKLENSWYFNYPFICAKNKLIRLSHKMEQHRDLSKEYRMYELANDYVAMMRIEKSPRKQFAILKKSLSDPIIAEISNLGEMLVNNGQIKDLELFSDIVANYYIDKVSSSHKEEVGKILYKHLDTIDEMFHTLNGMDLYK